MLSGNLISWWMQVTFVAALGVVLPMLFRIRHPKTQAAFYHLILVVCLVLPCIEPWHHPLVIENGAMQAVVNQLPKLSWLPYVVWIFAAGMVARFCWLAGGFLQIRRFRASATPLFPIPESIRQARMLTGADARFGISRNVEGPATLGHVDPIILVPESFLSMDHDAQLSIACHELIHVRRNDWLVTLFEEIIATLFWCNPAMWMLQSHARLNREKLVDSEVVELTAAPASYVLALLAMAGAPGQLKTVPAALFLNEGHLRHRVRSLLTKPNMSVGRLALSYSLIAGLFATFTIAATMWFPLIGEAQTIATLRKNHSLPPVLFAWSKAPLLNERPSPTFFDVHVVARPEPTKDQLYFSSDDPSENGPSEEVRTGLVEQRLKALPPPLYSMIQPFRILPTQGIRVFHPGEKATADEILNMQQALGEQTLVEVTQSEDGTIRQIKIQRRRSPDEISIGPLRFHIGPNSVIPTGPADAADGVH
jgi:beta-lactamase regulating signal transducer with metallopeptidase domain